MLLRSAREHYFNRVVIRDKHPEVPQLRKDPVPETSAHGGAAPTGIASCAGQLWAQTAHPSSR
jgi:hypothetical protein